MQDSCLNCGLCSQDSARARVCVCVCVYHLDCVGDVTAPGLSLSLSHTHTHTHTVKRSEAAADARCSSQCAERRRTGGTGSRYASAPGIYIPSRALTVTRAAFFSSFLALSSLLPSLFLLEKSIRRLAVRHGASWHGVCGCVE